MLIKQKSPEWFKIRKGRITSSEVWKIMGEGKSKTESLSETAKSYLLEKVSEKLGGYSSPALGQALDWGTDLEDTARDIYKAATGLDVQPCSFYTAGDHYGGSPDGLLLPEGIIEVKCPYKSANHFKHGMIKDAVSFKKIAPNYYYQCISNMICTNTKWCDFISYDPRVKDEYTMFIYRLDLQENEVTNVKERIRLAVEYMSELRKEIELVKLEVPSK
jgi:exodeoxyribonuclease (lambda-induced)